VCEMANASLENNRAMIRPLFQNGGFVVVDSAASHRKTPITAGIRKLKYSCKK